MTGRATYSCRSALPRLGRLVMLLVAGAAAVHAQGGPPGGTTYPVRNDGNYLVVRYTTDGTVLQRYSGFGVIGDLAVYDDTTLLVAETQAHRLSALTLDGQVAWTVPVRRPRCLQVLGPDRFLVCQDNPAAVVEIDRSGRVLWSVTTPLIDAVGAVRMPDGNTAVVEGRQDHHAVRVLSPDGKVLWSGTQDLAQPRGLALLTTGELATSGFDTGRMVYFTPFTDEVHVAGFCCHAEWASTTLEGGVLSVSAEQQIVQAWHPDRSVAWQFHTFYPGERVVMLRDGTVAVSVLRAPDRQCLNAGHERQRRSRSTAPSFRWLGIGAGTALLVVVALQWPILRRRRPSESGDIPFAAAPGPPSNPTSPAAPPWRQRLELSAYVFGAIAAATYAAFLHQQSQPGPIVDLTVYGGAVALAGACLALLQYRLPSGDDPWLARMRALAPMPAVPPSTRALWGLGAVLSAATVVGVIQANGEWVVATWVAGVLLLVGGAIQRPDRVSRGGWRPVGALAALLLTCLALRVYRLETCPPNLHLDMALWSEQTMRLLDGDASTLLTNGWAEIPLAGYLWSGLWTGLAGRSLAGARMASVMGSLLAILAAALLVRRLYGWRAAWMLVVILGTNHAFMHFSRIQSYMDPIPFHTLAVLGLVAGIETGRYEWFALAGVAGGYSALTYHAGRITPLMLAGMGALLVLRYPQIIRRRWGGLMLLAAVLLATVGPQGALYYSGRAYALGRSEMYPFFVGGHLDVARLVETIRIGLPRVVGAFWTYGDSSTQFGSSWPVFSPPLAALFAMAAGAAVLRPADIRGLLLIAWCGAVLFIGGVLTIDPPFWPRFVIAFVPACIACATALEWLLRGASAAGGRVGRTLATVGVVVLLGVTSWQQIGISMNYCAGIRNGESAPTVNPEWVQSAMGRDIQHWGTNAMVYILASNPNYYSCDHPTLHFYDYAVDAQDARDITQYIPFKDPRTIVCYVLPDSVEFIPAIRAAYPAAEVVPFYNNLGAPIFTRVVIRAPHQ